MPLYEYVCEACAHPFEELVSHDARPPCPKCASAKVERVMSAFAVGRTSAGAAPAGVCDGAGGCGGCGVGRSLCDN